jgi:hypothetical protein
MPTVEPAAPPTERQAARNEIKISMHSQLL